MLLSMQPLYKKFHREFRSSLVFDLIKPAALVGGTKNRLEEEEIFFKVFSSPRLLPGF
jgi:hypothetical protein